MTLNEAEARMLHTNRFEPVAPSAEFFHIAYASAHHAADYLGSAVPQLAFYSGANNRGINGFCAQPDRVWLFAGMAHSLAGHVAGHETIHAWQLSSLGPARSNSEREYREAQAERMAMAVCNQSGCAHSSHDNGDDYRRERAAITRAVGRPIPKRTTSTFPLVRGGWAVLS